MMIAVRSEAGPGATLAALHREHYRSLVKLASILVDDRDACEEIVQDAFVSVFRSTSRVRDDAKLPAYLRSAVLNGARSHLRKRQVRMTTGMTVLWLTMGGGIIVTLLSLAAFLPRPQAEYSVLQAVGLTSPDSGRVELDPSHVFSSIA